jgi:hypothetical protein
MQAARIALLREWVDAGETAWLHVTGDSMEPFLPLGARIQVARATPTDLRRGALLVYAMDDRLVCHRVLARQGAGVLGLLTVRGDAWRGVTSHVPHADVVGVVVAIGRHDRVVRLDTSARRMHGELLAARSWLVGRVVAVARRLKRAWVGTSGWAPTA